MEGRYARLDPVGYYKDYGEARLQEEYSKGIKEAWAQEKKEQGLNDKLFQKAVEKKQVDEKRQMILQTGEAQIDKIKYSLSPEGRNKHTGEANIDKIKKGESNYGNK